MAKVSIGLRGWRFDESSVFDADGEFRSLSEMDDDTRRRLLRLAAIHDRPCSACYLVHGEANVRRCRQASVVYGEPMDEVLLCAHHEPDFEYWYFEEGGVDHRATEGFSDRFYEWFVDGGRAPEGYAGTEHVDTSPADVPAPRIPDLSEFTVELPPDPAAEIDLREFGPEPISSRADLGLDDLDVDVPSDGGSALSPDGPHADGADEE